MKYNHIENNGLTQRLEPRSVMVSARRRRKSEAVFSHVNKIHESLSPSDQDKHLGLFCSIEDCWRQAHVMMIRGRHVQALILFAYMNSIAKEYIRKCRPLLTSS